VCVYFLVQDHHQRAPHVFTGEFGEWAKDVVAMLLASLVQLARVRLEHVITLLGPVHLFLEDAEFFLVIFYLLVYVVHGHACVRL